MSDENASGAAPRSARFAGLARTSLILAGISIAAKVLGLLREMVVTDQFGATRESDAFYLVFALWFQMAVGVMWMTTRVLVPRLISIAEKADAEEEADRLAGSTLLVYLVTLIPVALLVGWAAEPLARLFGSEFEPEEIALAARLLRYALPVLPLAAAGGVMLSLAHARGHFVLVQIATLGLNVGVVLSLVVGARYLGILSGAVGMTLGAALLVALFAAYYLRVRPGIGLSRKGASSGFGILGQTFVLSSVGHSGGYLMVLATRYWYALLPGGYLTCIGLAQRLLTLPATILQTAVLTTIMPPVAASAAEGDHANAHRLANKAARVLMVALVPTSLGLALLAGPVIQLIFGRGAFDEDAVALTSRLVVLLLPVSAAVWGRDLVATVLFAYGRTWVANLIGVVAVGVFALAAPPLVERWDVVGLLAAQALGDGLSLVVVVVIARMQFGLQWPGLASLALRLLVACVPALAVAWYSYMGGHLLAPEAGKLGLALQLGVATGLAAFVFVGACRLLHVTEADDIISLMLKRLRRRSGAVGAPAAAGSAPREDR